MWNRFLRFERPSRVAALSLALLALALPAVWAADQPTNTQSLTLGLPIDCNPGQNCWVVNYVDHDPTKGIRDFMCGVATYNGADGKGHNGTDFAIRDRAAMRAGVRILSSAAGTVVGVRDGMNDTPVNSADGAKALGGKYCGNGVRIDHGNGWTSQYCHLKNGSIAVQPKQAIKAGEVLGLVGLSGLTQYPHLHITLRHNGNIVDPFVGLERDKKCGLGQAPLWSKDIMTWLDYRPTAIFNLGFAPEKANPKRARNGDYSAAELASDSPALVLWADIFNVRKGDRIVHRIVTPDGRTLVEHTDTAKKNQARRFIFVGKPRRGIKWATGNYSGTVGLIPNGASSEPEFQQSTTVRIR
jgi:peptidase M23-like protein